MSGLGCCAKASPLRRGRACLLSIIKDSGSLSSGSLSLSVTHCACRCHPTLFTLPGRNSGLKKPARENVDLLATAVIVGDEVLGL